LCGTLTPHRNSFTVRFSKQWDIQSSPNAQALVLKDIVDGIAVAVDNAVLCGTGTGNEPLGVLNNTDLGVLSFGTGAATWTNVLEPEAALELANVDDDGTFGWAISPLTKNAWRKITRSPNSSLFLLDDDNRVAGYPSVSTNQLASTNQAIFARWSDVVCGVFGAVELLINPFTYAEYNLNSVTVTILVDTLVKHPESVIVSDAANH
jgi:HK97 family phage major capsid protein